ncbi:deoC [Symbiodinium sp. KB8]|nr:deoC [Symbiodinium sp. KB8]
MTTTEADILKLCQEAAEHNFKTVCVNGGWVATARAALDAAGATHVGVCAVVGFPLGAGSSLAKAFETQAAIADGAVEIDMVLPVGHFRSGAAGRKAALQDVQVVCGVTRNAGVALKVILETAALSDAEIAEAVSLCRQAGVEFVKTSTGFGPGGATPHAVSLLSKHASAEAGDGPAAQVKASGGVRTLSDALVMIRAGAHRIGASASVPIMTELTQLQRTSSSTALKMLQDDGVALQPAPTPPSRA